MPDDLHTDPLLRSLAGPCPPRPGPGARRELPGALPCGAGAPATEAGGCGLPSCRFLPERPRARRDRQCLRPLSGRGGPASRRPFRAVTHCLRTLGPLLVRGGGQRLIGTQVGRINLGKNEVLGRHGVPRQAAEHGKLPGVRHDVRQRPLQEPLGVMPFQSGVSRMSRANAESVEWEALDLAPNSGSCGTR